jgi:hypothetical protein
MKFIDSSPVKKRCKSSNRNVLQWKYCHFIQKTRKKEKIKRRGEERRGEERRRARVRVRARARKRKKKNIYKSKQKQKKKKMRKKTRNLTQKKQKFKRWLAHPPKRTYNYQINIYHLTNKNKLVLWLYPAQFFHLSSLIL